MQCLLIFADAKLAECSLLDNNTYASFNNCFVSLNKVIHILDEVDLSNLIGDDIISASNMFNGCKLLKKVTFGNFSPKNLKNISNMFSGCEQLEGVDIDVFRYDNLKDISGLFYNCKGFEKFDFGELNTKMHP